MTHKLSQNDYEELNQLIPKVSRLVSCCEFGVPLCMTLDSEEWTAILISLQFYRDTGKVVKNE